MKTIPNILKSAFDVMRRNFREGLAADEAKQAAADWRESKRREGYTEVRVSPTETRLIPPKAK